MAFFSTMLFALVAPCCLTDLPRVEPNDNRQPSGVRVGAVHEVLLEARVAAWLPNLEDDSSLTVQAFAAADGVPRIPGPLVRVRVGDAVRIIVRNAIPGSALTVHGLRPGAADSLHVAAGRSDTLHFVADQAGTFLYWGTTAGTPFGERAGREAQLTGAVVVDDPRRPSHPDERIFVITTTDILPDTTRPTNERDDVFEQAINGRSWPHTERIVHAVGDTVRWRVLNGGQLNHPMHLHGFHFRTVARGDGRRDAPLRDPATVVTELVRPGGTFAMEWVPTRAGNWLFHCHMVPHIVPFPPRSREERAHDAHDAVGHANRAMAALIVGITVQGDAAPGRELPARRLSLYAQQASAPSIGDSAFVRGYVLREGAEPRVDSVRVPGTPLVLRRGERTAITVVNRLPEVTSVHWHGLELESYYDGVSGFSGAGDRVAPMIAPGDSFTVIITPPRAGTFMYHPHMEEEDQLTAGLYGALLVVDSAESYEPDAEIMVVVGEGIAGGKRGRMINGAFEPPMRTLVAGQPYRIRVLNIGAAATIVLALQAGEAPLQWTALAKDGATLPPSAQIPGIAQARIGVGETYDFWWTPSRGASALRVSVGDALQAVQYLRFDAR